jgi:hypothetical protein
MVVGEGASLVERPGPECGQELVLGNEPVLQREQSEPAQGIAAVAMVRQTLKIERSDKPV